MTQESNTSSRAGQRPGGRMIRLDKRGGTRLKRALPGKVQARRMADVIANVKRRGKR